LKREFFTLDDFDVEGKTVLLRVDFNSPMDLNGNILNDSRIKSHLKTIKDLAEAKLVIIAHQSRPGKSDFKTMKAHSEILAKYVGRPVRYIDDIFGTYAKSCIVGIEPGEILLLENVRFYSEESIERTIDEHESSFLVQKLLPYIDFFVNDAFAVSHRPHLSVIGFSKALPSAAGRIMESEIENLGRALFGNSPVVYCLGGTKIDDSINVAENVLKNGSADSVLFCGVVGNLVLAAAGHDIGEVNMNLIEKLGYSRYIEVAKEMLQNYGDRIKYPVDVAINDNGERKDCSIEDAAKSGMPINDIGLETIVMYTNEISDAGTVVLNGPAGVSENPKFNIGTHSIIRAGANAGFSVIGGGHISAEVSRMGIENMFSHVSTGGGACIEFLAGQKLPGIEALKESYEIYLDDEDEE